MNQKIRLTLCLLTIMCIATCFFACDITRSQKSNHPNDQTSPLDQQSNDTDSPTSPSSKPLDDENSLTNPPHTLPKDQTESPIAFAQAIKVKKGMTYSEIHEILRNPGEDIGYGAILYEWELDNGDVLHVWFQSSGNLIATEVRIDQKS